jgi:hypothetical protein
MCDFDEAEWAEYVLYAEVARARASVSLRARPVEESTPSLTIPATGAVAA